MLYANPQSLNEKLSIQGVGKIYSSTFTALKDIDLAVQSGEFLTILGPSGSGKTTLLNIICGLTAPTRGQIIIDGVDCTNIPAHKRGLGVIFQNYSLFPHLSVGQNLSFPLEKRKVAPKLIGPKVSAALKLVGLDAFAHRLPAELSGGQQQRVALARCLIYQPALVLMDEPLAALDRKLREGMRAEIKRLHRETGVTIIFVTHDQEEALALSDRVCLMNHASIAQIATPREIYERPSSTFAAQFIGASNLVRGRMDANGKFNASKGAFATAVAIGPAQFDRDATLLIRPEHIRIGSPENAIAMGEVIDATYLGAETTLSVKLTEDLLMTIRRPADDVVANIGEVIGLTWKPEHARPLFN